MITTMMMTTVATATDKDEGEDKDDYDHEVDAHVDNTSDKIYRKKHIDKQKKANKHTQV